MKNENSLFQKVGGMTTVNLIVEKFYSKILNDESIGHFFPEDNLKALKSKQALFLAYVFGAPSIYAEFNLKEAHKHLNLKEEHFISVVQHLDSSLQELNFKESLKSEVIEIVKKTKNEILG